MRLQPFSVKVRGEISFQLFRERGKKKKTAKHSIRALARCAKHIGAWRGFDRRGVNRRAKCGAAAPVGGKCESRWAKELHLETASQMIAHMRCLLFDDQEKERLFVCAPLELRESPHRTTRASWNCCMCLRCNGNAGRISSFAFLCILKRAAFTGVTRPEASLPSGPRRSSGNDHGGEQQNAREKSNEGRHTSRLKMLLLWYFQEEEERLGSEHGG